MAMVHQSSDLSTLGCLSVLCSILEMLTLNLGCLSLGTLRELALDILLHDERSGLYLLSDLYLADEVVREQKVL